MLTAFIPTPTDLDNLRFVVEVITLVAVGLYLAWLLCEDIGDRAQRRLHAAACARRERARREARQRDRDDDAYYRRCLDTASQLGTRWPPERTVRS